MSKFKLFTHTDLDGIGCAVLSKFAFDDVDIEYCDYKDIDKKVRAFGESEEYKEYDKVFITDISVSEELANDMNIACDEGKVILLDHHATALGLNKYDWCNVKVKDDDGTPTSGTMMFYKYLIKEEYISRIFYNDRVIRNIARFTVVVRDYDTWRWKELGKDGLVCKQLNDLFHIYGRDQFIDWTLHNIIKMNYAPYFTEKDRALLEQKQKDIDIYVESKNKQITNIIDNFGYTCGVVFADRYISELGNRLSELNTELDYIAMIDISHGTVSYRTTRDDIDLGGEIAHSFGGGGHRKAAGSTFDSVGARGVVINQIIGLGDEIIS